MKKYLFLILLITTLATPVIGQKSERSTAQVAQESGMTVLLKGKTLQIQNIKNGDKIEILNILGVRVLEKKSDSTSIELQLDLQQGYYIIKVGTQVRKISLK
jgi:ABC-type molybdate transport system ATPase subunit